MLDNNDIENEKKELNSLYEKLLSSKENDLNNCEKKDALKEIQDIKKRYMDKNEEYNLAYRTNIDNERLRKENLYLKAELEYSKKLRAVVQARKNQQQKKK